MREYERSKVKSRGLAVRHKDQNKATIYTLGHSHKTIEQFLDKLSEYQIQVVVDVRSRPTSRWAPQFNRKSLEAVLIEHGIEYWYQGHSLGGLDENIEYDEAISEVVTLARVKRVVLLCAEADYSKCHRYITLTPDLERQNIIVKRLVWEKVGQKVTQTAQKTLFEEE